ncbi:lytic transglycosylase domain-containing protein [Desulfofundulus thermocisternus]|uniref:lytic transglycosylase domain-containing protein n=1 Tax=Desulfofundulus thermocisternus TaxID=42471 RepID=UPI00068B4AEE|nr:lytic transglycosylase domain-containing protein [Desulfofundulus thermocisternus]
MFVPVASLIPDHASLQNNMPGGISAAPDQAFAFMLASALESSLKNEKTGEGKQVAGDISPLSITLFFLLLGAGNGEILPLWTALSLLLSGEGNREQKPAAAGSNERPSGAGRYDALFDRVAAKYGLEPALLKAVARVESSFNPHAVSPAGAVGLMQLMPATAAAMGVRNPLDPGENLEGGARYLKSLLEKFNGNVELALAAYNAGPGAVQRYGGIPPYRETQQYLQRVAAARYEFLV